MKDPANRPCAAVLIPTELPTLHDDDSGIAADRKLVDYYFQQVKQLPAGPERISAAYIALRFLPVADMERIIPLLHDEDMWIAARAVELVEHRHWEPGIAELGKVIESGGHNACTAACYALLRWPQCELVQQERDRLSNCLKGKARASWKQWKHVIKRSETNNKCRPWWKFW